MQHYWCAQWRRPFLCHVATRLIAERLNNKNLLQMGAAGIVTAESGSSYGTDVNATETGGEPSRVLHGKRWNCSILQLPRVETDYLGAFCFLVHPPHSRLFIMLLSSCELCVKCHASSY